MRVRAAAALLLVTLCLYNAHWLLQLQHQRHCRADLIRAVFFNQSAMCVYTSNLLTAIEGAYSLLLKQAVSYALGVMSREVTVRIGALAA